MLLFPIVTYNNLIHLKKTDYLLQKLYSYLVFNDILLYKTSLFINIYTFILTSSFVEYFNEQNYIVNIEYYQNIY